MKCRPGSLSLANKLILGGEKSTRAQPAVFTLSHWIEGPPSTKGLGDHNNKEAANVGSVRRLKKTTIVTHNRARLLFIKLQESALNFFVRWLLLSESPSRSSSTLSIKEGAQGEELHHHHHESRGKSVERERETRQRQTKKQQKKKKITRSGLLLRDIPKLSDRRMTSVIKFIFWRWLTWSSFLELVLIIALFACCAYQCTELLSDYYKYPTYVSVTKVMNDDFRTDLPAVTLCNMNRISKETLKKNMPHLNESHFMAITLGTFVSVDNFTLTLNGSSSSSTGAAEGTGGGGDNTTAVSADEMAALMGTYKSTEIDWIKVARFLTNSTPIRYFDMMPAYDLIETVTCANIWGVHLPCQNFRRIESIQEVASCVTLFHDSALWDPRDSAVKEFEDAIKSKTASFTPGRHASEGMELMLGTLAGAENDPSAGFGQDEPVDELKMRVEMSNMEILRLRLDFRADDYSNKHTTVGGLLSIHSNSVVGMMNHIVYNLEPGFWYTHYIERFDYKRLPYPYDTNCYDYERNRYEWVDNDVWWKANRAKAHKLMRRQAANPSQADSEYVEKLRGRSLSKRECMYICTAELSATKCNCWPKGRPYIRGNSVDVNGTMRWCDHSFLLREHASGNLSSVAGDDLFFQLCTRDFSQRCTDACPDECNFSSFDVTQQARSWPSHEARRYIADPTLLARIKNEAECCATVSVIYAAPASTLHVTEPKYTRQDMVTTISGNIEAWIGLSAVHVYRFLEQLYDALVEAQLISASTGPPGSNGRRLGDFLISILTSLKAKLSQLFTYLFHQSTRLLLFRSKTNREVIRSSVGSIGSSSGRA